jgi:uncharacterized membrane protein
VRSELHELMRAPYGRIFDLAADVERWPSLLPHYRYVRRVPDAERRFSMGARRGPIPVRWEAIERPLRDDRRIEFEHTGGVTRGMQVAWLFDERADGAVDVSIEHRLELDWPLIGGFAAERVIGPQFIEAIAARTLRRIRQVAEEMDR